jgi:hypothetical protein
LTISVVVTMALAQLGPNAPFGTTHLPLAGFLEPVSYRHHFGQTKWFLAIKIECS